MDWIGSHLDDIWSFTLQNAWLAGVPTLIGLVLSIPLGWVARRWSWAYVPVVAGTGLLYTIPSLALFILMPLILGTQVLDPVNVAMAFMPVVGEARYGRMLAAAGESVLGRAAVRAGVGAVEGGVMLIVINEGVRAGFMFRGVPFSGVHGRAGSIGAMRTGPDRVPLDSVVGLDTLRAVMSPSEREQLRADGELQLVPEIRAWIREAAGHLVDAIVATAGFLAPGAILVGGNLPANLIDELIRQMSVERGGTAIRPFITPWLSPIRRTSFAGAGIAVGAALLPFFGVLLPSPAATSQRPQTIA